MDNQKQSVIDRLKQANNILVTVSANPSVDQLAACIGLTLMMDVLEKHATAVFSGTVPSTIEFLQPEKTLERNTDSLRDFIIALDKSKADKLRYKVEDKVVKIFITPYRTSISEKDLQFSQGDFNVDVVVCLGVHDQKDLDQAITSHGRILHDATVIGVNTTAGNNIGTLNWQNPQASSLAEMIASLADSFGKNLLDTQIATALLTGVVAETERFSNGKTSPDTMKISAQLMGAGANQQLVATKLAEPPPPPPEPHHDTPPSSGTSQNGLPKNNDGTLRIAHEKNERASSPSAMPSSDNDNNASLPPEEPEEPQIHIDERGQLHRLDTEEREFLSGRGPDEEPIFGQQDIDEERPSGAPPESSKLALTPPTFDGKLTANSRAEELEPTTDPLSQPPSSQHQPILTHNNSSATPPPKTIELPPVASNDNKTLTQIEESVGSSHVAPDSGSVRSDVSSALNNAPSGSEFPRPRTDLSAKPLGADLHAPAGAVPAQSTSDTNPGKQSAPPPPPPTPTEPLGSLAEPLNTNEPAPAADSPSAQPLDMPLPPTSMPPSNTTPPASPSNNSPQGPPPPMPPPIVPLIEPTG